MNDGAGANLSRGGGHISWTIITLLLHIYIYLCVDVDPRQGWNDANFQGKGLLLCFKTNLNIKFHWQRGIRNIWISSDYLFHVPWGRENAHLLKQDIEQTRRNCNRCWRNDPPFGSHRRRSKQSTHIFFPLLWPSWSFSLLKVSCSHQTNARAKPAKHHAIPINFASRTCQLTHLNRIFY